MTGQESIAALNAHAPDFLRLLGGRVVALDSPGKSCTFEFEVGHEYCHSVDIVQGGFVTAMLDAAMSHACFGTDPEINNVSSLEIKTSYLEPTRAGRSIAIGKVVKAGYKTVFLEGQLYNTEGLLTATASSIAKLGRGPTFDD